MRMVALVAGRVDLQEVLVAGVDVQGAEAAPGLEPWESRRLAGLDTAEEGGKGPINAFQRLHRHRASFGCPFRVVLAHQGELAALAGERERDATHLPGVTPFLQRGVVQPRVGPHPLVEATVAVAGQLDGDLVGAGGHQKTGSVSAVRLSGKIVHGGNLSTRLSSDRRCVNYSAGRFLYFKHHNAPAIIRSTNGPTSPGGAFSCHNQVRKKEDFMSRLNPFINPLTGLLECLYAGCGREIPSDHYLCKTHYFRLSEGSVGACPGQGCKRFKSISYDCCAECSKHLEPESDPAWEAGDEGWSEFFAYLLVSAEGDWYPGHTRSLRNRVWLHRSAGARPPRAATTAWRGSRSSHPGRGGRPRAGAEAPGGNRPLRRPRPGVRLPGPRRAGASHEGAWLSGELARTRAGDVLRKTPRSVRMPASNRPRSPKRSGVYL